MLPTSNVFRFVFALAGVPLMLCFGICDAAYAQTPVEPGSKPKFETAKVEAICDSIRVFNQRYTSARGYRIILFNGSNRALASKAKENMYRLDEEMDIIFEYKHPNFKVKVGNFPSKYEALLYLQKVTTVFPDAIVVPETVKLR